MKRFLSILLCMCMLASFFTVSAVAEEEETPAHEHVWGEGIVTTEPSCVPGVKTYSCACGDSYTEDIDPIKGHEYTGSVTTEPSCVPGVMTYSCVCGDSYTEGIDPVKSHEYTGSVTTEPSCVPGVMTYSCVCGDSYTEGIDPVKSHEYTGSVTTEPTCVPGVMTYSCACGDSYTEDIDPVKSHEYTGSVTTEPSCVSGVMTYSCACGDSYTEDIDPIKDHEYTGSVTTEPSCVSGVMTYSCVCGDSYTEGIDPVKDHEYTGSVTTEPSCVPGVMTYSCACGDSYTEDIDPVKSHEYTGSVTTEPSCAPGVMTYSCACGDSYTEDIAPVKSHEYTGSVTTEPSCAPGVMTYSCACGDSYTEDIDPIKDHVWDEGKVTTEPTTKAEGVRTYTCACSATKTEAIEKLSKLTKLKSMLKSGTGSYDLAADGKFYLGNAAGDEAYSHTYSSSISLDTGSMGVHSRAGLERDKDWTVHRPAGPIQDAGSYTFVIEGLGNYAGQSVDLVYTIKQLPLEPSITLSQTEFEYDGTAHTPTFSLGQHGYTITKFNVSYSDNINAGTCTYTITPSTESNFTFDTITGTFTIKKANIPDASITAPTAISGLKYNGEAQKLIAPGKLSSKDHGTMVYSLNGKDFSESIPVAEMPGDYPVFYKVLGGKNYNDSKVKEVKASIAKTPASDVAQMIINLDWLPDGQVDPGNKHQRDAVLKVWAAYLKLSAAEQSKIPDYLYNWLYYLVSNTDYATLSGGGSWYEGKRGGISFSAIDPRHKFGAVYVDGELIHHSNYSYYWYGENDYDQDDILVLTLKPEYLKTLKSGKYDITISFTNGYTTSYFSIWDGTGAPPTGDSANLPLWTALLIMSTAAMAAAVYGLRKKKES